MLIYSRDKNQGTCRSGKGGERPICDPGSELLLGGGARAEGINGGIIIHIV